MPALSAVEGMARPIPFNQIKGWFFDLDGTLMDTDDQAVDALARRLRLFGDAGARAMARRLVMMGESPMNRVMTLMDIAGLDAWAFAMRRRLSRHMRPTFRLIPGVIPLLEYLASMGKLAVVSTRSCSDAEEFLRQHNLGPHFALSVTQDTTKRLKPHPQPVAYAARYLDLSPSECAMVGDTPADIVSARRAGAWAIGVLCGFGEEDELWRAGAHRVVASTADILPLVTSETCQHSRNLPNCPRLADAVTGIE